MRITIEKSVSDDLVDVFYGVYAEAFDPLRTRAAARHLLTAEEFGDEMRDPRVDKYVVWDDDGGPVGLTTLTTDLTAIGWISGDYYAARFPEHAARGALYYLGYTLVHPGHERAGIVARIIALIVRRMHDDAAVCAFDVSAHNDLAHGIGAKMANIARWRPMDFVTVDQQSYYAAIFHGPQAPHVPRPRADRPAAVAAPGPAANRDAGGGERGGGERGGGERGGGERGGGVAVTERVGLRTVSLADRPDLAPGVPAVLASRWPAFMLAGRPGHGVDLNRMLAMDAPEHQILLVDDADRVLGVGLSVPLTWDGTVDGLPAGWDGAVTASARLLAAGATATMVSALSVTLTPEAAGRGHAATIVRAMKDAAVRAGAPGMLVPVRPVWKPRYPLVPLDRYIGWRAADGQVFDPWLRLHLGLGARVLAVADTSLTVTGSVAEWEAWTAMPLPDSGSYPIPGGLVPLEVDRSADRGIYREPNVWVLHPAS